MSSQTIHGIIYRDAESDQWVAQCIEYDVVTHGDSEDDARAMLKEAVELYLADAGENELELFYQRVQGPVAVHEIAIDAPTLLRS
jgi:predicted RNase H-like HicB family nuclease